MLRRGVILQTRYRIRHELGQGTFGTVYSVHDGFTGDYVALKMVRKSDEEELESGLTEVKVLREIGCIPGVPRCLHHFETASHLAIVTRQKLATLDFLYKNNRPPWFQPKTIVAIGWNLVSILEAVHNKNIVHRDIDSTNVMVSMDYETRAPITIIDWGVSLDLNRVRDPNRRDRSFCHSFSVSSRMANGFVATKKCDLLMHLYTMFEVARQWPFNKEYLNKSIAERELFEQNPESFKIPNYLLNVAMEIVKVGALAKPNYKAVKKAYEEAIPGFDPKSFKFEVTEDRRGGPRMI